MLISYARSFAIKVPGLVGVLAHCLAILTNSVHNPQTRIKKTLRVEFLQLEHSVTLPTATRIPSRAYLMPLAALRHVQGASFNTASAARARISGLSVPISSLICSSLFSDWCQPRFSLSTGSSCVDKSSRNASLTPRWRSNPWMTLLQSQDILSCARRSWLRLM